MTSTVLPRISEMHGLSRRLQSVACMLLQPDETRSRQWISTTGKNTAATALKVISIGTLLAVTHSWGFLPLECDYAMT